MRSLEEFELVMKLVASGMSDYAISRATEVPPSTVFDWRHKGAGGWTPGFDASASICPVCDEDEFDDFSYAYLLGLYLGDGCLVPIHRGVYKLEITLDQAYPNIINEGLGVIDAMKLHGRPAGRRHREGCDEIYSYWKHWICFFPQHGPGPKHLRHIALESWQQQVVSTHPCRLIRGLIHSDGCRYINRVSVGHEYVNYDFTNNSPQIQTIFTDACDRMGIEWRQASWKKILITRRADVSKMEAIVGPKS
jgi:hypothetical protein